MKYLILPMALISAFFVPKSYSNIYDMDDLLSPKKVPTIDYECINRNYPRVESLDRCFAIYKESSSTQSKDGCDTIFEVDPRFSNSEQLSLVVRKQRHTSTKPVYCTVYSSYSTRVIISDMQETETNECPPDGSPLHKYLVDSYGSPMCAKLLEDPDPEPEPEPEPDPNAKCDEFGNNSMLPPKAGVGSEGQNACYTNPSNGLSCQYVQGGDNFTATGKQCTGDENDYGDRPTPEPPPDGADPNCYNYGSQGQVLICDVDPNEGCNPIIINGTTQYQCPSGCGSIDDVYFCSYDDKDGDGIPDDKNGNGVPDKDETCVNNKCKPNTPDDTTPPTTEKPDMTETNTRLDGVIGELDSIGGKINKTNQTLNGINSGIQGIKQGQDKANGLLSGMSKDTGLIADNTDAIAGNTKGLLETVSKTDVGNTFNPDLSTGFYESSYENGFAGIWAEKSILFEQTETIQFLQQFRFNAGGSPPDTQLCFNMGGSMDFGCADLPIPSPQLLAILKIFILITAAFLCRALIFGG